ncbi:MAG: response regulator [Bacteroidetes bacterium]|jgi:two-component system LytT family response regulator|nr:response regulator [Bacteroidota bacterium]
MTTDRTYTALIVDDEELARRGVRSRLRDVDDIEVVGECGSGRAAVEAIRAHAPDLVFLDVQMPGLDGFDVIDTIGPEAMPVVLFVTAYDEYALRAFDVHALDYLLKPLDEDRFRQALHRARQRLREQSASAFGQRLADLLAEVNTEVTPASSGDDAPVDRFVVKTGGRITFVEVAEIDWIEAAGDYVRLHLGDRVHLLRETMKNLEASLDPERFLRIHRSTIINTDRLKELRPYGSSEYIVILKDGTELKLSRGYRDALDDFFDGAL